MAAALDCLDEISWPEYRNALHALVHASCYGAGSAGDSAATPIFGRTVFGGKNRTIIELDAGRNLHQPMARA